MKPRIVLLSAFLTPFRSGAEACVEEVSALLKDRYDFVIVTARMQSGLPATGMLNGIPVVRVGVGLPFDKWLFPFLAPFAVRRVAPDIVHAVLESFAGLALVFCRLTAPRARRLLTCQSTNTRLLLRPMHRSAHRITAISQTLVQRAASHGRSDVTLIRNGIPYQEIRAACVRIPKKEGEILFVGRLEPMKGVDTLLAAFQLLHSRSDLEHLHLSIVGDGSLRRRLERRARVLGISASVTFHGYLQPPALYDAYARATVFCGLSRSEALGNVFLEAQAAGCAVIGTRVGGIPDVIEDRKTGLLVPPENIEAARVALEAALTDMRLREELSTQAVAHASEYDWPLIAEQYAEVYEGI